MLTQELQQAIAHSLNVHSSYSANNLNIQPIGGGSINDTYRIMVQNDHYIFCKVNSATNFPHLFRQESRGLFLIEQQMIIGTPKVIDILEMNDQQILLLEWIKPGERTLSFWKKFGSRLAQMHKVTNEFFGLNDNNYMGSVTQNNMPANNWIDFFRNQRLQPLVEHCSQHHLLPYEYLKLFDNLYQHLPSIFDADQRPALVHGDLWSGNFMCSEASEPILIDPAVYFGHPSVDLGMSTLFGGFHPSFYEAYNHYQPLPSNYHEQWQICNLYPLLIHLRLFGSSYLPSILQTIKVFN